MFTSTVDWGVILRSWKHAGDNSDVYVLSYVNTKKVHYYSEIRQTVKAKMGLKVHLHNFDIKYRGKSNLYHL